MFQGLYLHILDLKNRRKFYYEFGQVCRAIFCLQYLLYTKTKFKHVNHRHTHTHLKNIEKTNMGLAYL